MKRVGWELAPGVRSLMHLMEMVRQAITPAIGTNVGMSASAGSNGYKFKRSKTDCWLGVFYERPDTLLLRLWGYPCDEKSARELGFRREGELWERELPLSSEAVHFFALSKNKQLECIERFLSEGLEQRFVKNKEECT